MSSRDLPAIIPVFPLSGALLLPRGRLPLNIFEPRYLAMVRAALAAERVIGMIQPQDGDSRAKVPVLYGTGCAGRITAFTETDDGRFLITLTGVTRFRVAEELSCVTPYRQVAVDYAPFAHDLETPEVPEGTDVDGLREVARNRFGVSLAGGLGPLQGKAFRIGHLGDSNAATILGCLGGVEAALRAQGIPIGPDGLRRAIDSLVADAG